MILKGIFIILLHLALGEGLSCLTGGFIPGSVFGMLLLFLSLLLKIVKPEDVRTVAEFLTGNMTVLFVPASIGIMEQWGLIKVNLIPWLAVTVISTVCVILVTGYTQQGLESAVRKIRRRAEK